ncbi:MAG: DUF2079 domain-containing protein [Cyanobacteria bacterium P01_H01_bin.152]
MVLNSMRALDWMASHRRLLWIVTIFWLLMVLSILNRHWAMYPSFSTHDQGIFNQIFWNGTQGRFFEGTLSSGESAAVLFDNQLPDVNYRRLGQHFTPIHLLWLPLYALLPFSATLLVLQVTLVTAGGVALYFLARQRLSEQVAGWMTLGYFCAQAVMAPNLANFHDFSQIPLWVFLMLLAVERQRWGWAIAAIILIFLCREDVGILLFGFGLYFVVSRRHGWLGGALCVASVTHVVFTTTVLMPIFSAEVGTNFLAFSYSNYVEGDASTVDLLLAFLKRPDRVLVDLFVPVGSTLRFLLGHWLPLLFVPAISPAAWICTAPPLATLLLRSDTHIALSMQLRYTVMVVPGLFYGAVMWWSHRGPALSRRTRSLWTACLCLSLLFTFTLNPSRTWSFIIPDSVDPWVHLTLPKQWHHAGAVRSLMTQIPPDASVAATDNLLPHVSGRRAILRFPTLQYRDDAGEAVKVDYVLVDFWQLQQYAAAFSGSQQRLSDWTPLIQTLLNEQDYGIVAAVPGVFLLQREMPSDATARALWQTFEAEFAP